MLTAMGSIGALDVDDVPESLLGAGAPPPLGRLLPPGAEPRSAAGVLRGGARPRPDDVVRHELGSDRALGRRRPRDAPRGRPVLPERGGGDADRRHRRPGGGRAALAATGAEGRLDGGPIVVVKRGPAGAVAARRRARLPSASPAMPVEPVDTTGAGDSFNAGFLRAWLDGGTLARLPRARRRLRRAVDAGGRRGRRPADVRRGDGGARGLAGERMTAGRGSCSSPRTRRSTGCTSWSG